METPISSPWYSLWGGWTPTKAPTIVANFWAPWWMSSESRTISHQSIFFFLSIHIVCDKYRWYIYIYIIYVSIISSFISWYQCPSHAEWSPPPSTLLSGRPLGRQNATDLMSFPSCTRRPSFLALGPERAGFFCGKIPIENGWELGARLKFWRKAPYSCLQGCIKIWRVDNNLKCCLRREWGNDP